MINKKKEFVVGFDYGTKKIGVAVGNIFTKITTPLFNLEPIKQEPMFKKLGGVVEEWKPFMFIIGMPELEDQGNHPLKTLIKNFKLELENRYDRPVILINERLTSHEAYKMKRLYPKNMSLDAIAASLILDTWLTDRTTPTD